MPPISSFSFSSSPGGLSSSPINLIKKYFLLIKLNCLLSHFVLHPHCLLHPRQVCPDYLYLHHLLGLFLYFHPLHFLVLLHHLLVSLQVALQVDLLVDHLLVDHLLVDLHPHQPLDLKKNINNLIAFKSN
jgi:hypothetical protein